MKPRLDGGERRICVLRCRPAVFKDDALREEAHDVRYVLIAVEPLRRPRQTIRQNVQHELPALQTVPELHGTPHEERLVRAQAAWLFQTHERRLPRSERYANRLFSCPQTNHLRLAFSHERHDAGKRLRKKHCLFLFRCTQDIEPEVIEPREGGIARCLPLFQQKEGDGRRKAVIPFLVQDSRTIRKSLRLFLKRIGKFFP